VGAAAARAEDDGRHAAAARIAASIHAQCPATSISRPTTPAPARTMSASGSTSNGGRVSAVRQLGPQRGVVLAASERRSSPSTQRSG
jgi:hypothetical protein